MIIILYAIGLFFIYLYLKSIDKRYESLYLIAYNFIAVVVMLIYTYMSTTGGTFSDIFFDVIYRTPAIMTFQGETDGLGNQQLFVMFIASVLTLGAVVYIFFYQAITHSMIRTQIFLSRNVYVVCGDDNLAQPLIDDIRKNSPRTPIVYINEKAEVDEFDEPQIQLIRGTLQATRNYIDKLNKNKNYTFVLLPTENNNNITWLTDLNRIGEHVKSIKVTAFLDNSLMRHMDLEFENIDAFLISKEALLIHNFMALNLPIDLMIQKGLCTSVNGVYKSCKSLNLGLIGYLPLSEEYLLEVIENSGIEDINSDKWAIKASIFDEQYKIKKAGMYQDYPYFKDDNCIHFEKYCPGSQKFYEHIEKKADKYHEFVICLGDTEKNIQMALRLIRLYDKLGKDIPRPQIIVVLHDQANGSIRLLQDQKNVLFLQYNESIYSYEDLVLRKTDLEAERIHNEYMNSSHTTTKWSQLGTFTKQSNRAVIWDVPNKMALMPALEDLKSNSNTNMNITEETESSFWELAKYEHRRWCAFHYTHGWSLLPVSELTDTEIQNGTTKHLDEKRHICLVPWNELDSLPQSEPGILKQYDYDNIKRIVL